MRLSLPISIVCAALISGCNNSSDSKPNGTSKGLISPSEINLEQFDANEDSTAFLSFDEQHLALTTLKDSARISYLQSSAQKAKATDRPSDNQPATSFFDQDPIAKEVKKDMLRTDLCVTNLSEQQADKNTSSVRFSTTGSRCPLNISMSMNSSATVSQSRMDMAAKGDMKFVVNEQASDEMRQQDIIGGQYVMDVKMSMDIPSEQNQSFSMSADAQVNGSLNSKKYGLSTFKQRQVMAMQMLISNSNKQPSQMSMRALAQIEFTSQLQKIVLTVKMDNTEASAQIRCTMNKAELDLRTCEDVIKQLDLEPTYSSNSSSTIID